MATPHGVVRPAEVAPTERKYIVSRPTAETACNPGV
jgi:hypothetical protein